jgi:hypothetical protein
MSRLEQQPEDAEKTAAYQVEELAEWLQEILYFCYDAGSNFPPATEKELNRTYRTLKRFSVYFYGAGERPLSYEPNSGRFQKGSSK